MFHWWTPNTLWARSPGPNPRTRKTENQQPTHHVMCVRLRGMEAKRPWRTKETQAPSLVTNEKCKTQESTPQMATATLPPCCHNATCFAMPFTIERYSKSIRQKLSFHNCNMVFLLQGPRRVNAMWCVCLLVWIMLFAHHVPDKSQHEHALTACATLPVNCSLEVEQWRPGRTNKQFCSNSTVLFTKHKRELQNARYTIQRVATYIWKRQLQTWISQDSVPHLSDTEVLRNNQTQTDSSIETARIYSMNSMIDTNS